MIPLAAFAAGAALGALVARGRGGNRLDIAQYAAGYAIACGLVGVFAAILLGRAL